ncbi:hypothetical protein CKO51_01390 [Rhodopirellula sp. SM50]|nr:DUF1552 domain-containing protein [Rhodopirellula sp. SM50]PAY21260.1 hypothetical protein CKO51_01390 [Rhodopirellula sp. SM50]
MKKQHRRSLLKGLGGALTLPLLESAANSTADSAVAESAPSRAPLRFLVVGNPFGMHPDNFFPEQFGKKYRSPKTLQSLDWLRDRLTILSHTDHGMKSGHGREVAFLSGVLPETSAAFPEKNMSIDQLIARRTGGDVRFPSIHTTLQRGIRMSWNANGVDIKPFTDPQRLFDHLFLNLTEQERQVRRQLLKRNGSVLDTVGEQFAIIRRNASPTDQQRLDQFATSLRELERNFSDRTVWVDRDKPRFDISEHFDDSEVTIANRYNAIFDMIGYAFQTDLTRVATVGFSPDLSYTDVDGVTRGYHACTHNGKKEDIVNELVSIESFQISQLSRCLKKLDEIPEPDGDGSMLDHTVVLFGSGMGYGGTHSNRDLPILVAGGGFRHLGHVDTRNASGSNMPLCNLYVTLLQRFGIERDQFNTSTGRFELNFESEHSNPTAQPS